MPLQPGTQVGPYEITAPLGAGGMGEVFRATDTKLKREVAIKVLPDDWAGDHDRLARFEREAHVLAALNHPHIASIYGLEESGGLPCLVLELVEGQTLAEKLATGALPLDNALEIAKQIASALEAAHEKGVVHRDLKPANVKLTPDGMVKVLDFGLAKALAEEPTGTSADASHSPTLTMAATRAGTILGTAAYMSPEQARGKPVDRRTDVWAFGCVLFEMLAGKQAFAGETASDSLARILEREPDWEALPATTPWKLRELLQRSLAKDPRNRLHDVADARIEIEEILANPDAPQADIRTARRSAWLRPLPWVLSAGLALTVLLLLGDHLGDRTVEAQPTTHVSVILPTELRLNTERPTILALSPDGRRLAAVVDDGGVQRLYLRDLGKSEGVVVEGTDWATSPFFSPDGEWLGFKVELEEKLKKVSVGGGAPVVIVDDVWGRGPIWGADDYVIFPRRYDTGLWRVPAAGGTAEPLTEKDASQESAGHYWPQLIDGGRTLLFTNYRTSSEDSQVVARSMETGDQTVLLEGATFGRYVAPGYLLYMRQGIIFAVRLNVDALEVGDSPVPVIDDVWSQDQIYGAAHFDVAENGTLAYISQSSAYPPSRLVRVDRAGGEEKLDVEPGYFAAPRFSPDGRRLAVTIAKGGQRDLWVYELPSGRATRLTNEQHAAETPVWRADGREIIYARGGTKLELYRIPSDGSDEPTLLLSSDNDLWPGDVSQDGKWLLFLETCEATNSDIMVLPLEEGGKPRPFVQTRFMELDPTFSPDGRWVAYDSNESDRLEVYVQAFPAGGTKTRVSIDGGSGPLWSRDGKELYYLNGYKMMAAPVRRDGDGLVFGKPTMLFDTHHETHFTGLDHDLAPDGRFLMVKLAPEREPRRIEIVLNWRAELERLVPAE